MTDTPEDDAIIREMRRVFSSMIRTVLANADGPDGRLTGTELEHLLKKRYPDRKMDSWSALSAASVGLGMLDSAKESQKRQRNSRIDKLDLPKARREELKAVPVKPRRVIMGGAKNLERRSKDLITNEVCHENRMVPFVSRGDKTQLGNRNFRISSDASSCVFSMLADKTCRTVTTKKRNGSIVTKQVRSYVHQTVVLHLATMRGNQGRLLPVLAELASKKLISLEFKMDATHLHVTFDPEDLPKVKPKDGSRDLRHPEHMAPLDWIPGRIVCGDGNPQWFGAACIENLGDPEKLSDVRVIDNALIDLTDVPSGNAMVAREAIAGICNVLIGMCRRTLSGRIAIETGLGHLTSRGPWKKANALINGWARDIFLQMLKRKAALAGIEVVEVAAAYSTTIGNIWFELPDACASACEIGRRGLMASPPVKREKSKFKRIAAASAAKAEREAAEAAAKKSGTKLVKEKRKGILPSFDREDMPPHVAARLQELERKLQSREDDRHCRKRDVSAPADRRKEREHGAESSALPEATVAKGLPIGTWTGFHRGMKSAALGVRRPHPGREEDPRFARRRLSRKCRPGMVIRCTGAYKGSADSSKPMEVTTPEMVPSTIRCE